jgi:CPA2 family monovalent cation:H+ antiporter-2
MEGLFIELLIALAAALAGGALASLLRQPAILGFLVIGLLLSPFTPGLVVSRASIDALAEIGVIFLMFAVGVQLSLPELVRTGRVAITGGIVQVLLMIGVGVAAGVALGWGLVESLVFGAVLSNSSSTALSRVLLERGELDSPHGKLGLAWSSVQDISTVVLVAVFTALSPTAAPGGQWLELVKSALFLTVVSPAALWVLPRVFERIALARSRELFTLAVATVALGMAWTAAQLGVSLALGAFVAGVVVGESPKAHRILGDAIPLRDIFSGMFFVSIGMSIDPAFVAAHWPMVVVAAVLTVFVKGTVTTVVALLVGCSRRVAVMVGAGLAQSAEFSFLLAQTGKQLGLIGPELFGTVLAGAAVSILLAPAVPTVGLAALERLGGGRPKQHDDPAHGDGHTIVCGYGRVGRIVVGLLQRTGAKVVVIEEEPAIARALRHSGIAVVEGDAAQAPALDRAGIGSASVLVICVPERMAVRQIVDYAQSCNKQLTVLARAHHEAERRHLYALGAKEVVMGELALAIELGRRSAEALGLDATLVEAELEVLRRGEPAPRSP